MAAASCSETHYSTIKMVSYQLRLESSYTETVRSANELDIAVYSKQPSQTHVCVVRQHNADSKTLSGDWMISWRHQTTAPSLVMSVQHNCLLHPSYVFRVQHVVICYHLEELRCTHYNIYNTTTKLFESCVPTVQVTCASQRTSHLRRQLSCSMPGGGGLGTKSQPEDQILWQIYLWFAPVTPGR
jgi:hypothetical protein